jgi:hypothetical protein
MSVFGSLVMFPMSDLTYLERNTLEKLFKMEGGYVLDFSDRTFQEFVADAVQRNIYDQKYQYASGSKANCLRGFWKVETNLIVGKLIQELTNYTTTLNNYDSSLVPKANTIAQRLLDSPNVADIDAIAATTDDRTFEALANTVRESIENNKPETGLDRLHTFVIKYVRKLCAYSGLPADRELPLHSLFGSYVKYLRINNLIKSEMTVRILKMSISTLEAFNTVRNEESLAHDNEVLNYDESIFIFNHICALMRLLQTIEQQRQRV